MAKGKPKKRTSDKLRALMRTQEINDLLSKSITESEALQNSGDDRPTYESHVIDLLEGKGSRTRAPARATKASKAKASSRPSRKPKRR